jgi:hypothetical protein
MGAKNAVVFLAMILAAYCFYAQGQSEVAYDMGRGCMYSHINEVEHSWATTDGRVWKLYTAPNLTKDDLWYKNNYRNAWRAGVSASASDMFYHGDGGDCEDWKNV